MEQIIDLNGLKGGFHKIWPLKNKHDFSILQNYLQKINFAIQDINSEIGNEKDIYAKEFIYIIVQATWIENAIERIISLYRKDVIEKFVYSNDIYCRHQDYLKAIRSFVVAHPLGTNRHKLYGFDGDFICVDIRKKDDITMPFMKDNRFYHLSIEGLEQKRQDDDLYLYVYSEKADGMKFFQYIGCSVSDIIDTVKVFIDKLYVLDKFLRKQKQAYFKKEK